mmetsp:Transcript_5508/g.9360  ORF Transcript_5508/g.9360 Transcript_5508/m.9360 type:complete len:82 (+) Transcript_5508:518-763(+)
MVEAGLKFMKSEVPKNPEGYRMGFHRPPRNTQFHLHLHLIVLPLKQAKHEKTYGENLTRPNEVLDYLNKLLKIYENRSQLL